MIMTGTPSGVALGMANTPWLTDGDVVEVEIEKIGTIRNKFVVK
jgi:2-keto-4-pentenoate hydratase/2-oxohepta-3-ene-1,7-dioic acid hydratase in catechol pathway